MDIHKIVKEILEVDKKKDEILDFLKSKNSLTDTLKRYPVSEQQINFCQSEKDSNQRLQKLKGRKDPLTNILNRRSYEEHLNSSTHQKGYFLMLDTTKKDIRKNSERLAIANAAIESADKTLYKAKESGRNRVAHSLKEDQTK